MRQPRICTRPLSVLALLLAGCGGGGGGGTNARLEGTVTVPNLAAAGAGRVVSDATTDDVAHQARDAGALAHGTLVALHGTVGGDDRRDVFRLRVPAGESFRVSATAGVQVEVFDAALGVCAARAGAGAPAALIAADATTVDVVVAAGQGPREYRIEVQGGGAAATVRLPLVPTATPAPSALQAGYLGADHEMVPGEVIVLHDAAAIGVASDQLRALGLVAAPAVPGPMQRYQVAAGAPPLAATGTSLAVHTALLAHRAAQVPGVRAASPNYLYRALQASQTPNDSLFRLQWHYDQIRAPQAWALFPAVPGSPSVVVAVVDTGVVLTHPDFAGRLGAGFDMISDAARALDGNGIDDDPNDPGDNFGTGLPSSFHGTHVAGTVGAATNNSTGVAGMDWACRLMPIRVLGRGGSGTLEDIAQGIRFAAGLPNVSNTLPVQRCDVMNLSLGGPGFSTVLQAACEAASAAGVLLVAAAGNDNTSTPIYPASFDVCLSVGAIRFDFTRAPYSNFAATVDVNAPGGDTSIDQNEDGEPDGVLSCLAAEQTGSIVVGFGFLQGTSMACPHVAGLAALVKAAKPAAAAGELRGLIEGNTFSRGGSTRIVDAFGAVQAAQGTSAPNPILAIDPGNVGLRDPETTATAALSNIGQQTLLTLIPPSPADISYESGSNWITAATLEGAATSTISHTTLRITADRTGLANGRYDAVVTLRSSTPNVAPGQLAVTLFVGTSQSGSDTVYVLVVDEVTLETLGQAETDATTGFAWAMPDVAPGRYLLVAGTDRENDNNNTIGDEGELFGIWPNSDSPQVLEILGNQPVISGLDFPIELQSVQLSVGGRPRLGKPIRLRR